MDPLEPEVLAGVMSHGLKWDFDPPVPDVDEVQDEVPPGCSGPDPDPDVPVHPSTFPFLGLDGRLLLPRCGLRAVSPSGGAYSDLSGLPRKLPAGSSGLMPPRELVLTGSLAPRPGLLWRLLLLLFPSLMRVSVRKVEKGSFDGVDAIWLACLRTKPGIRHFSVRISVPVFFLFIILLDIMMYIYQNLKASM